MLEQARFAPPLQAGLGFAGLTRHAELGVLEAALARFDLAEMPEGAGYLHLTAGAELNLDPSAGLPWVRRTLHTADVDELKSWIGRGDDEELLQAEMPSAAWSGPALARHELRPEQWEDVQKAAHIYLYGDRRLVRSYRETIARCFGPFEVDLWLGDKLVVESGASLVLRRPTALLVRDVEIHEGGSLYLYNVASLSLGALRKIASPRAPH